MLTGQKLTGLEHHSNLESSTCTLWQGPLMSRYFSEDDDQVRCNGIVVVTHQEHQQAMKTRTAEADIVTRIMSDSDSEVNNDKDLSIPSTTSTTTNGVRRRALSMAETQPSVETVVVKARRAAQSLWMLLHAQNCSLGQRCPHTGCQEAKLLHLHLKTCNAGPNGECPMLYHGCDQSRKLLAHYRRCRNLRARQAGGGIGKQQHPSLSHHCLVCSLVARQARTMLERSSPPSMSGSVFKSSTTNVKKGSATSTALRKVSYVLSAGDADVLHGVSSASNRTAQPNSAMKMPPPPPRTSMLNTAIAASKGDVIGGSSSDLLARLYATAKQLDTEEPTVPSQSQSQRERFICDSEMIDQTALSLNGDDINKSVLSDDVDMDAYRVRSPSCGSKPASSNNVSLSPCETILEEES